MSGDPRGGLRSILRVAAIAGLVVATACASARDPEGEGPTGVPVRVEVDNHGTYNVVVYAVYAGQRHRMGEVTALGDRTLLLPELVPYRARVRFQVDPIGPTRRFLSQDVYLDRGDTVRIHVQPNIRQTTVSIR